MGDDLLVEGEAILVGPGIESRAHSPAHQAHAGRRLEDVRGKRAALRVELDFDVAGIGKPHHLLARVEHNHFGKHAHHHELLSHAIGPLHRELRDFRRTT
jgi:hypothetical protein